MISLFEVPLAYLIDEWHFSRIGASISLFATLVICSIPSALSMGPWSDITIFNKSIFDLLDYVACNVLMPLSALFVIAITGWFFWDKTQFELTLNKKRDAWWLKTLRFMLAVVAPCFIVVVAVSNFL
jgi:NSS family neurotransmitter:Na+ symporter